MSSAWLILKLVVPLYILSDFLLYYDLLRHISFLFTPLTELLHLPAEAAVAVAGGMLLNVYAAIAFAAPLGLTAYQWTILGIFLGVCHALVVESAIMAKLGVSYGYSIVLRIVGAFLAVLPVLFLPPSFLLILLFARRRLPRCCLRVWGRCLANLFCKPGFFR